MKRNRLLFAIIGLIIINFIATSAISLGSVYRTMTTDNGDMAISISQNVYDAMVTELTKPVTVGRTITNTDTLITLLKNEDSYTKEEMEEQLKRFLLPYANHFGYSAISVISDHSKNYYTQLGFNKTVDTENDAHDIWYKNFLDTGEWYIFNLDTDEVNGGSWTLFLDSRIEDTDGNLLGVCGIGMDMSYLRDILLALQEEYDITIDLVDDEGNRHFNVQSENFTSGVGSYRDAMDVDYYFEQVDDHYVVTRYIPELDWNLVIKKESHVGSLYSSILINNLIVMGIILLFVLFVAAFLIRRNQGHLIGLSETDALTGIKNRHGGEKAIADFLKAGKGGMFILLDVDKFKSINDTFGHGVGDEVIKAVGRALTDTFRDSDIVFRLGGDEFSAFALGINDREKGEPLIERLFAYIDKISIPELGERKVEISVGVSFAKGESSESFRSLYERADQGLYKSKETSGNFANYSE